MLELVFFGRGGQGCLVASKILATALFNSGKYVQAFPAFGGERRGAPVKAFLRADETAIRRRSLIYEADYAVVLDETLMEEDVIQDEIKAAASILLNSTRSPMDFQELTAKRVATLDATAIARELNIGEPTAPIVNTIILGAFARFSGLINMKLLSESIHKIVPDQSEKNIAGAKRAYEEVRENEGG